MVDVIICRTLYDTSNILQLNISSISQRAPSKSLTFQLDIIIFYKRKTNFYDLKASVYW